MRKFLAFVEACSAFPRIRSAILASPPDGLERVTTEASSQESMNFKKSAAGQQFLNRYSNRLAIGLALSLLVHGFLLSLHFGVPGLGFPGLALPWEPRQARSPELTVQLANAPRIPKPAAEKAEPKIEFEQDAQTPASGQQAIPARPVSSSGIAVSVPAREPVLNKHAPGKIMVEAPAVQAPKDIGDKQNTAAEQKRPPANSTPPIMVTQDQRDNFSLPPPATGDPDSPEPPDPPEPKLAVTTDAAPKPAEIAESPPAMVSKTVEAPAPAVNAQQQIQAAQKIIDQENAIRARAAEENTRLAKAAEELRQQREKQETLTRRKAAELEKQRLAELATQKANEAAAAALLRQQEALAAQRAEEEAARRALLTEAKRQEEAKKAEVVRLELEAKRQDEAKRLDQVRAERQTLELEARKQAALAEETARQQAQALERQKQDEERARMEEREKAQELAAKLKVEAESKARSEALAAQQREVLRKGSESTAAAIAHAETGRAKSEASPARTAAAIDQALRSFSLPRNSDIVRADPRATPQPTETSDRSQRRSVFGSIDQDIGLKMYVESWRLKIERNGSLNYAQSARDKARGETIVTVSIRSDGSVDDITIHRSSGQQALDEAVRRIVRLNARYGAFPPDVARKYDVIDIRRIWSFEESLKIVEEVR
ncbi:hypothetical protein BH11PSE11_BH11PSE11_12420 [soil metagenome]